MVGRIPLGEVGVGHERIGYEKPSEISPLLTTRERGPTSDHTRGHGQSKEPEGRLKAFLLSGRRDRRFRQDDITPFTAYTSMAEGEEIAPQT